MIFRLKAASLGRLSCSCTSPRAQPKIMRIRVLPAMSKADAIGCRASALLLRSRWESLMDLYGASGHAQHRMPRMGLKLPCYTNSQFRSTRSTCSFSALLLRGGRPVATATQRPPRIVLRKNSGASLGRSELRNGITGLVVRSRRPALEGRLRSAQWLSSGPYGAMPMTRHSSGP